MVPGDSVTIGGSKISLSENKRAGRFKVKGGKTVKVSQTNDPRLAVEEAMARPDPRVQKQERRRARRAAAKTESRRDLNEGAGTGTSDALESKLRENLEFNLGKKNRDDYDDAYASVLQGALAEKGDLGEWARTRREDTTAEGSWGAGLIQGYLAVERMVKSREVTPVITGAGVGLGRTVVSEDTVVVAGKPKKASSQTTDRLLAILNSAYSTPESKAAAGRELDRRRARGRGL
jgi:hypothetical protein